MANWAAEIRARLRARRIDDTRHDRVVEELAIHLDDRHRALLARGVSPADARDSVLLELDDEALERELRRAERQAPPEIPALGGARTTIVEDLWQDMRYASRALTKSPGFTTVAVLTLALGVGASSAIFSIVNAVMLRPLPYPEPERLVRVWESNPARGWPTFSASQPNFLDWHARQSSFAALAATSGSSFTVASAQGAEIVRGQRVSAEFLSVLGVSPRLGRDFLAEEDRPDAGARVTILSNGFWQRRFGGDESVLGQQISLSGVSHLVVGVLPATFSWANTELLVPLRPNPKESRGDHQMLVVGRLQPGATLQQAHDDLAAIAASLATQYPASNEGWSVRLASFYDWLVPRDVRDSLVVLSGSVGLVLLIACANVASLLLARGARRAKELAIRVALGASRWRIVRQLFVESLMLAALAAIAGVAVGAAAARLLVTYGPASVPRLAETTFDGHVVLFCVALSATTAVLFGLMPALQLSRPRPVEALQDAARGSSGGPKGQRLRSALTVAEVALSVALLIAAGLLMRSFWQLQQVNPGFAVQPLTMARLSLVNPSYPTNADRRIFHARLIDELITLPGVVAAATASGVPMAGGNTSTEIKVPGLEVRDGALPSAGWRLVSPGYFATMGIPLRGADFSANDGDRAGQITIISETMARMYWPNQDPIGRSVHVYSLGNRPRTIVGVAGDVRTAGLDAEPLPIVYLSSEQYALNPVNVVWRGSAASQATQISAVRGLVQRLDPTAAVYDVRPLEGIVQESYGPRRFNLYLVGVFAGVALLLSAIGLFGVMAYVVAQRTREIGVRLALGAARRDIFRLVLGRGIVLAGVGAAIGVAGAFWLTSIMQSLLYSVSARDPQTFVAVPLLLVAVALLACYVPARRAMRVDPVTALRGD
jgi:putative ABC transport system permease protein